jgi:hypothetical protein
MDIPFLKEWANRARNAQQEINVIIAQSKISRTASVIDAAYDAAFGAHVNGKRWGRSSFLRGWDTAANGGAQADNPYFDHRTTDGQVTFSRGYSKRWDAGWQAYHKAAKGTQS